MMTTSFSCDDKATLIAYLYGEVDAAARRRVEDHLVTCAACAAEVTALGDVRGGLGLWVPPDAELGFAIVRKDVRKSDQPAARVLRPAQWWRTVPAWVQAAAAVVVLAAGLGIANLHVRSGPDGFSVSTGWMTAPAMAPIVAEPYDGAAIEGLQQKLIALEQQLRDEIRSSRDQQPTAARAATAPSDDATIRRVQQMLAASEERQSQELALRMTQLTSDMNLQRRADWQRIVQTLGQVDEQMLRQRQMMNNVIRVSASGQQ